MAFKTRFQFAILAAAASSALLFSACGDDENPTPEEPGAGGKGSGGKGSGGGKSSGGSTNPDSGAGGENSGGGGSGSGGKASGGADSSGGAENTGGVVIVPDAGCEEDGCWSCEEKAKPVHFLNACTGSQCVPYDNSGLPSPLPALP